MNNDFNSKAYSFLVINVKYPCIFIPIQVTLKHSMIILSVHSHLQNYQVALSKLLSLSVSDPPHKAIGGSVKFGLATLSQVCFVLQIIQNVYLHIFKLKS